MDRDRAQPDSLKRATEDALKAIIDPIVNIMVDSGITVPDFANIVRDRAVLNAAARFANETGRTSKSRISIVTGLPRSVIARVLGSSELPAPGPRGQHPARKVLDAWHRIPTFLSSDGTPAILPIFGSRISFERLVNKYSGGAPVRAMLDELTRIDAVERLSDQRVRAKSRVPIVSGLNKSAISALGERGRDLLESLTKNLRSTSSPLFEATAVITDADSEMLPLIRREVSQQGSSFISSIDALLNASRKKPRQMESGEIRSPRRVGVTIYYFEDNDDHRTGPSNSSVPNHRTNLRRAGKRGPGKRGLSSKDKTIRVGSK